MEGFTHQLNMIQEGSTNQLILEDKKLELKLAPPGEDYNYAYNYTGNDKTMHGSKRGFQDIFEVKTGLDKFLSSNNENQKHKISVPEKPVEKKPFPAAAAAAAYCSSDEAKSNSSHKRVVPGSVVGWPPIQSFRKNLASSSSSKPATEPSSKIQKEGKSDDLKNSLFVKINMDGVPIGRKVDLNAYNNYELLSSAVDKLFRGLLAAQTDSIAVLNKDGGETNAITGVLDGCREYTLVYEDNEGDKMLVGDVPWHGDLGPLSTPKASSCGEVFPYTYNLIISIFHIRCEINNNMNMFLSSVKRLRVLRKSELPMVHLNSRKLGKTT